MQHQAARFPIAPCLIWLLAVTGVATSGCTTTRYGLLGPSAHGAAGAWRNPATAEHQPPQSPIDSLQETSQSLAQRLTDALTHRSPLDTRPLEDEPRVRWLNTDDTPAARSASTSIKEPRVVDAPPPRPTPIDQAVERQPAVERRPAVERPPPAGLESDRPGLSARLRQAIRSGNQPAVEKAIAAMGLSLADPDRILHDADLEPLGPKHRQVARQYHQVLVTLTQQMASGGDRVDVDRLVDRIDEVFADRPIRINRIELCQRVRGYGVYEPFENRVFLAGREQPAIVYAEIKDFGTQETKLGRYEVNLAQEVVLYNESDGLAVWQQPKVDIVDESRNRRHDFFVVQMIRLPARLTVGKYLLKVRITDNSNQSLDESTIPVQIVADQSMVGGPKP